MFTSFSNSPSRDRTNNPSVYSRMVSPQIDNNLRRKGYGKAMIKLALKYAFEITGAKLVQLNVFDENTAAKY